MRSPPKPLIRFILIFSLLASVYIIYLMAAGMRPKSARLRAGPPSVMDQQLQQQLQQLDQEAKQEEQQARKEAVEELEEEEAEEEEAREEQREEQQRKAEEREEEQRQEEEREERRKEAEREQKAREAERIEEQERQVELKAAEEKEKEEKARQEAKERERREEEEEEEKDKERQQKAKDKEQKERVRQEIARKQRAREESEKEERQRQREAARIKANKAKKIRKPSNRRYTTQDGIVVRLMNPSAYSDDQKIDCFPLQTAADKAAICTYTSQEDPAVSKVLNNEQVWAGDRVRTMKQVLQQNPGMGLIDIGASLGVFTITAASMGRQVVGVEPFPPNLKHLAKTMRNNPELKDRIQIVTNPVSNQYETMQFWLEDKRPGGAELHSMNEEADMLEDETYERVEDKEAHSILTDDILELIKFKKAILRLDIAGAQYKALQSSYKLFDQLDITHVFLEWDKSSLTLEKRDFFLAFFKVRGYTVHRAEPTLEKLAFNDKAAASSWPSYILFIKS